MGIGCVGVVRLVLVLALLVTLVLTFDQTPDTDLNEDVRRLDGNKEDALLTEKTCYGQIVPKLSHEECMDLMWGVLSDADLHK